MCVQTSTHDRKLKDEMNVNGSTTTLTKIENECNGI